jgi:hypothetical protein
MNDSDYSSTRDDAWARLRGSMKDVFDELGGGAAYLRAERSQFYAAGQDRLYATQPPDQSLGDE